MAQPRGCASIETAWLPPLGGRRHLVRGVKRLPEHRLSGEHL